jgi:hypothetical protein
MNQSIYSEVGFFSVGNKKGISNFERINCIVVQLQAGRGMSTRRKAQLR